MKKNIIAIAGKISTWKTYMLNMFKKIASDKNLKILFLDIDTIRRYILCYSNKKVDIEYRKYLINLLWIDNYSENYAINGIDLQNSIFNNKTKYLTYKKEISRKIWIEIQKHMRGYENIIIERALLVEDNFLNINIDYIIYLNTVNKNIKNRLKWKDLDEKQISERLNKFYTTKKISSILNKKYLNNHTIIDTNSFLEEDYYKFLFDKVIDKNV